MDPLPVQSAVLNYATPEKKGEFRAHWTIRVMLLAGVVGFFVPFQADDSSLSIALLCTSELSQEPVSLSDYALAGACCGMALALPLWLMSVLPTRWRTLWALVLYGSLVVGLLALVGCMVYAAYLTVNADSLFDTRPSGLILLVILASGGAVTVLALIRHNCLPSVVWLLLSSAYSATAGCFLALPFAFKSARIGFWLMLLNLAAVVIQSVRTARQRW
jgi:hypothetical protein